MWGDARDSSRNFGSGASQRQRARLLSRINNRAPSGEQANLLPENVSAVGMVARLQEVAQNPVIKLSMG